MCGDIWSIPGLIGDDLTIFAEIDVEGVLVGFEELSGLADASLYVGGGAVILVIEIDKGHCTGAALIQTSDISVEGETAAEQVLLVGIVCSRAILDLPDESAVILTNDELRSSCLQIAAVPTLSIVDLRGAQSSHWEGLKCGISHSRRIFVASEGQERDIGEGDTIVRITSWLDSRAGVRSLERAHAVIDVAPSGEDDRHVTIEGTGEILNIVATVGAEIH